VANFRFNPENFLLGLGVGWGSAYVLYRARRSISAVTESVTRQAASAQEYATRSADSRYIGDLIRDCQAAHLAGRLVPLSDVLIEPRFLPAPPLAAPPDEDEGAISVFHVVPHVPDYPYLQAPYNIETLSIDDLASGHRAIALLGLPGSGRSTALRAIALWALGKVEFTPPIDRIQQQIEQEEARLSAADRAKRVKERLQIEESARAAVARGRAIESDTLQEVRRKETPSFRKQTPIYAHMANITLSSSEFGRQIDPAEPFVRAVQAHVGGVTAKTIPRNIYQRLAAGDALVLLDGFDDLSPREQEELRPWLRAFVEMYSNNFIIVAGPASGYGPLIQAGLAPVFLRSWNDVDTNTAADRWAEHWGAISGKRRGGGSPDDAMISAAKADNRARSAFDLTLKLWGQYHDPGADRYEAWMRVVIERLIPGNLSLGVLLPALSRAATAQLERGTFTAAALESLPQSTADDQAVPAQAIPENTAGIDALFAPTGHDADIDSLFDETASLINPQPGEQEGQTSADAAQTPGNAAKPQSTGAKEQFKVIESLIKSGLLLRFRDGRYQFRHPMIAAYLASLTIRDMPSDELLMKSERAAWEPAFGFAAMHTPIDSIVSRRMDAPPDVLYDPMLNLTRWLNYADGKSVWKGTLLKALGNHFVAAQQYPAVRERIAAALVGARDTSALVIFRKALRHPLAEVRRLSCLAIGAMRDDASIGELVALVQDSDADVQLAAGLALGAISTPAALEEMVIALTEGSEALRKAIAEAFAAIPDEGYPVLYEAVTHEQMMLRRASVFGLRRINTAWALSAIYRTSLEDDQWYVRSAAEEALYSVRLSSGDGGPKAYPPVEAIPWLRDWAAKQGEAVAQAAQSPTDVLLMALDDPDPQIQKLALANIGQLGMTDPIDLLYRALRHQQPEVRTVAHEALIALQMQLGQPLPAPA
jgi:HEAT repeat protein